MEEQLVQVDMQMNSHMRCDLSQCFDHTDIVKKEFVPVTIEVYPTKCIIRKRLRNLLAR
jgi:hypothetical protein